MSFQENTKKEKYKLPLQGHFTFHAFHPKAVNGIPFFGRGSVWQVFWLGALAPSHSIFAEQWLLQLLLTSFFRKRPEALTATGIAPELNRIPF